MGRRILIEAGSFPPDTDFVAALIPVGDYTQRFEADARRLCAAVDACAGIPTDALEAGVVASLLAAAEELSTIIQRLEKSYLPDAIQLPREMVESVLSAHDIIAKAKGEN